MHFSTIMAAAIAIAATSANPLAAPQAAPTPCTTTLDFASLDLSPTTTIYLATSTATSFVDCQGCSLVLKDIDGIGPVRIITETDFDFDPAGTTTTTTVCSPTDVFSVL